MEHSMLNYKQYALTDKYVDSYLHAVFIARTRDI